MFIKLLRWQAFLLFFFSFCFVSSAQLQKSVEEFAALLLSAKTSQERSAIMDVNKDLLKAELFENVFSQGIEFAENQELSKSFNAFELAVQIGEKLNNKSLTARAVLEIGNNHFDLDDYDKSLEYFQKSLKLREEAQDKDGIASSLRHIAKVHSARGNFTLALDYLQRAIANLDEIKNKNIAAGVLIELAITENAVGRYSSSLTHSKQALEIYEKTDHKYGILSSSLNIASNYIRLNDFDLALEVAVKALAFAEQLNSKPYIAVALNLMGSCYFEKGNFSKAFQYLQKSLQAQKEINNLSGIADAVGNIGLIYFQQRNFEVAIRYYSDSLAIETMLGRKNEAALMLVRICTAYNRMNDYKRAFESCVKAVTLSEETQSDTAIAQSHGTLGTLNMIQGRYAEAIKMFEKSISVFKKTEDKKKVSTVLANLSTAYLLNNNPREALRYAEESMEYSRQVGKHELTWAVIEGYAKVLSALNRNDEARKSYLESIEALEALRNDAAGSDIQQVNFLEYRGYPYQGLVELMIKENKPDEALIYAERMKSRLLLEMLQRNRVNVTKMMTTQEREEERTLKNEIININSQIYKESISEKPNPKRIEELNSQLQKARINQQNFEAKLYTTHPNLKTERGQTELFKIEQASALLQDNQTALIEYFFSQKSVYVFVLTKDSNGKSNVKVHKLNSSEVEIETLTEKYREQLASRNALFKENSTKLYEMLIKPLEAELKGKTKLVIVPDGVLWELPFQALTGNGKRYLIEDYAVTYTPSLSVSVEMAKRKKQNANPTLIAFGNPFLGKEKDSPNLFRTRAGNFSPLPEAENEVNKLAQLYGKEKSIVFTGTSARESELKTKAGEYKVIHLATHGILNDSSPMYSQIVLSQEENQKEEDGLLEAWEIIEMNLNADLVVLSACETARGRVSEGEGMIGLSWALFVAGTSTTVVSQWKVDSVSTSNLMLEFHRNLKAKSTKSEAMRKAVLKLMQDKQYNHPFYWAAFVVVGDGN